MGAWWWPVQTHPGGQVQLLTGAGRMAPPAFTGTGGGIYDGDHLGAAGTEALRDVPQAVAAALKGVAARQCGDGRCL